MSGVGKTTSCRDFVGRHPEWLYLRASRLLGEATGETPETLRTSSSQAIGINQLLLGDAVRRARSERQFAPTLIDGHAVIDNDEGLVPVPVEAVAALEPDGLILLEASAATLASRRAAPGRDRPARTAEELARHALLERETVQEYAATLGLPLIRFDAEGPFRLDPLIGALVRSGRVP